MVNGGALGETELLSILKQVSSLSGVHEIMTHPGISDEILRNQYNWGYHWQDELSAMTSDNVRRYISQHNIELINYGGFVMSKMMRRGIFMFVLLFAVSLGIIYYTIDLEALKNNNNF